MIVDYYLGKGEDSCGNKISDYLNYTENELEDEREYVAWVFPLPEKTSGWADAPVLSQEDIVRFREDSILKEMARSAVNHYLKFLNNSVGWRSTVSPSHIRITRMIRFLASIGMAEEAIKISKWCSERGGSKKIKATWESSVAYKPPWERPTEESQADSKEASES